jgi:hypothetical protein
MAICVLVFDPMKKSSIQKFEQDLDSHLSNGWEVLNAVAGNRPGVAEGVRTVRSSRIISPEQKDYVVYVLRNAKMEQETMPELTV